MLILSRKLNESIVIDGSIIVRIVRVEGDVVKLGIEAPKNVPVHRQEVYEEIQKNNEQALALSKPRVVVPKLFLGTLSKQENTPKPLAAKTGSA